MRLHLLRSLILPTLALVALHASIITAQELEEKAGAIRLENLSPKDVLAIVGRLIDAGRNDDALALLRRLEADGAGGIERDFLDGMLALARKDYRRAETMFRRILQRDPSLVRVRLELARTLFLEKKDEEADYHFKLAIAARPDPAVIANVARFREAIRARRAWRFNINLGIAPDSNINSATNTERVEILGLPFQLAPNSRAKSGTGIVVGGDASIRLWRNSKVPVYLGAYGRAVHYPDHDFDDYYIGGEFGPEFRLSGGRLRIAATGLRRWYGGKPLVGSIGGRLNYDKVIGGKLGLEAGLAVRHNAYPRRDDVDGWDLEGSVALNHALDKSTLGFAYTSVQRSIASDPGQSNWQGRLGLGVLREIGWGLRPQISIEVARQINDAPLVLFGGTRRDWRLQASASIYKRDWNVAGFAPSLKLSWTRNFSTLSIYDQRRLRAEFGIAKAF